jgi:glucose/arabinose dehydrogenase
MSTPAAAVPPGFLEEIVVTELAEGVGITFGSDGRWFYWTLDGVVYTKADDEDPAAVVIDLSDEVGIMENQGLIGFALDPAFDVNGHIYLMYSVDWEWWITGGDPDPGMMDLEQDTFARLTRYTCTAGKGGYTCDDRTVLIGITPDEGIPITSDSHGPGTLRFAEDGSLLASIGDGACYLRNPDLPDTGGERHPACSDNSAEEKGILRAKDMVGAYRSQLVDSYSGKILRLDVSDIDPKLGVAGYPSNPFYEAKAPYAARSKVWTLGLRNPFRFGLRPGSGSSDPADGNPGVIYVGEVGWNTREEIDIVTGGGANLGWPVWEGLSFTPFFRDVPTENLDAPNPLFDGGACGQEFFYFTDLLVQDTLGKPSFPNPCDDGVQIDSAPTFMHRRPVLDHKHFENETRYPAFDEKGEAISRSIDHPDSPVEGEPYNGRSAMAGVFNDGVRFPRSYRDVHFYADSFGIGAGQGWIRTMEVDEDDAPSRVDEFRSPGSGGFVVSLAFDPSYYGLYFVHYSTGIGGSIRRITYDCNGNGVPDACDVETGTSDDFNENGIPDECECPGDVDDSGVVDTADLVSLLAAWGPCDECPEDADGNGTVDVADLLIVLAAWGECPM